MVINNKQYRGIAILLFLCLFIYLIIRAYINEPYHDEIAAFFNYSEIGKIFGKGVIQDAQNHLLNTYLTHFCYLLFGDHFFFLRIPSLLSFPIYFVGVYKLSLLLKENNQRILFLVGLTSILFITEYFAYSRGYALGITFFIWMIIYSIKWVEKQTLQNALFLYFFTYLAIFSNLIYFGSACLAAFLIGIYHLKNIRTFQLKENGLFFGLHICFFLSIIPFLWLSYVLKNGGALYHGSLDGLWLTTGKSLTRNVLFYDADWQKIIWIILLMIFIIISFYQVKKNGLWNQLKEKEILISYYFFGNLVIILLLAFFLKVNYPLDRVGMYLIPLFLLLFIFNILKNKYTKYLLYILLFFPLSFIVKMSLHTSVFSQKDRMTTAFYQKVRSQISPENSLSIYPVLCLTWCKHERKFNGSKINPSSKLEIDSRNDFVITRYQNFSEYNKSSEYKIIAYDQSSTLIALKRKKLFTRIPRIKNNISVSSTRKKKIALLKLTDLEKYKNKNFLIQIKGMLEISNSFDKVGFFIHTSEKHYIETCTQRWLQGSKKQKFPININYVLTENDNLDDKLFVYICNPEGRLITFKNGKITAFELILENGTR